MFMKNIALLFAIILLGACAKMNDKHDEFLARGETIYIGKVDSVTTFPGRERLLLKYWLSDPRAKNVTVYWGVNNSKSKVLKVTPHAATEPLELYFGGDEYLTEGNYTFSWISTDDHGNKSMVFEKIASVYGPLYQEKLLNRRATEAKVNDADNVEITWAGATSDEEIGIEMYYTDKSGNAVEVYYPTLSTSQTLTDVDYLKGVTYRTLYIPEPTAIDTFYTELTRLDVSKVVNITQGKPVTHSDCDPVNYIGELAVDGITGTSASRWVSNNSNTEHWIEVDLQGTYSINAFRMWRDVSQAAQKMKQFKLQAYVNDQWKDVVSESSNEEALYYKEFAAVETSKVRLYVPAYTDNRARVYEIAVYSVIKY